MKDRGGLSATPASPWGTTPPHFTALQSCRSVFNSAVRNINPCLFIHPLKVRGSVGAESIPGWGRAAGAVPPATPSSGAQHPPSPTPALQMHPAPWHRHQGCRRATASGPGSDGQCISNAGAHANPTAAHPRSTPAPGKRGKAPVQPHRCGARPTRVPLGSRGRGSARCGGPGLPGRRSRAVFPQQSIKHSAQRFRCKSLPIQAHC